MSNLKDYGPDAYTVGWVSATHEEYVAALAFLENRHAPLKEQAPSDHNTYALGDSAGHKVVIAVMPSGGYGVVSAAITVAHMLHTFINIKYGLMVGIGGGVPSKVNDVRLGDVVVSQPVKNVHGGVIQYDFGKVKQEKPFEQTRFLNQPPRMLQSAIAALKAKHILYDHDYEELVEKALTHHSRLKAGGYGRPPSSTDRLYKAEVVYQKNASRSYRDLEQRQTRPQPNQTVIHYGLIASGNQVIKDALFRDSVSKAHGVLCFDMEAAGLMNDFPCIVIRGICDYADSHKNDMWQPYAAMVAAAYAHDLLKTMAPTRPPNKYYSCSGPSPDLSFSFSFQLSQDCQPGLEAANSQEQLLLLPPPEADEREVAWQHSPGELEILDGYCFKYEEGGKIPAANSKAHVSSMHALPAAARYASIRSNSGHQRAAPIWYAAYEQKVEFEEPAEPSPQRKEVYVAPSAKRHSKQVGHSPDSSSPEAEEQYNGWLSLKGAERKASIAFMDQLLSSRVVFADGEIRKSEFHLYACRNWATHFRQGDFQLPGDATYVDQARGLCEEVSYDSSYWVDECWWSIFHRAPPDGLDALKVASALGLDVVVGFILGNGNVKLKRSKHRRYLEVTLHKSLALILAARQGHLGVVRMLHEHDMDVCYRDSDGLSALDYAQGSGRLAVVKYLQNAQPNEEVAEERTKCFERNGGQCRAHQILQAPQLFGTPP